MTTNNLINNTKQYIAGIHQFITVGTGSTSVLIADIISQPDVNLMTLQNGNVGIGTVNPTSTLHVIGNILSTGTVTASNVSVIGDFVTLNTITSNTEQMVITNAGTGPALKVTQTGDNSVAEFYDNESGIALFVGNNGNVGVGTTNPEATLHIRPNTSSTGVVLDQIGTGSILDIKDGGVSKVIIDGNGNVGIGTTTPTEKLHVNGNIGIGTNGAAFLIPLGNAPLYAARAWVNFDGSSVGFGNTTSFFTSPIRSAGNVSGVKRTIAGSFNIQFAVSMPTVNYVIIGSANTSVNSADGNRWCTGYPISTNECTVAIRSVSNILENAAWINVVIFC